MADNKTTIEISAVDKTSAALSSVRQGIGGLQSSIAALGVTLSAGAFVGFIKQSIDAADAMNDLSQRTGVGIKQLAGYKLAAEQSGASLEAVAKGIKAFSTYAAQNGDVLKKLGVDTQNADRAMVQLADVFATLPDGMEKSALATKLFGKAGNDLIPMLNLGSKGLGEARDKAKEFGERMAELAPKADKFNDKLGELKLRAEGWGIAIAGPVIDGINKIAGALEKEINVKPGSIGYYLRYGNNQTIRSGQQIWDAQTAAANAGSGTGKPAGAAAVTAAVLGAGEDAAKRLKAARDDLIKQSESWVKGIEKETASLAEQIVAERDRIDQMGLTKSQQDDLAGSKLDLAAAAKEEEAAALSAAAAYAGPQHDAYVQAATDLREQAKAMRELAGLKREGALKNAGVEAAQEAERASKRAAETFEREFKQAAEYINNRITDAILDGGKSGLELLEDVAKTIILRPLIQGIFQPVSASVAGWPGMIPGGGIGGGSSGGGMSFGLPGSGLGNIISSAGSLFGSSTLSAFGAGMGLTGAEAAAAAAAYNAAGMGGIGTALSFGSTVGAALPWVGGALAIGSALGLFGGGGEDPHNNASISGLQLGIRKSGLFGVLENDGVTGPSSLVAGRTSGSGMWADSTALSNEQVKQITAQVAAVFASAGEVANVLGLSTAGLDSVSVSSMTSGTRSPGLAPYYSSIEQALGALSEEIARTLMPNVADFARAGETAAQTLNRLAMEAQAATAAQQAARLGRVGELGKIASNSDLFASRLDQQRALAYAANDQAFAIDILGRSSASANTGTVRSAEGMAAEVAALRQDIRAIAAALVPSSNKTAKVLSRWDGDGMPDVRAA